MAKINGPTSFSTSKVKATTAPRSFADFLTGKSTTTYTRPTKAVKAPKSTKTKAFRPAGPTSNGIGVGP